MTSIEEPILPRVEKMNQKMSDADLDDLSDEEIEELRQEALELGDDLTEMGEDLKKAFVPVAQQIMESLRPVAELAAEMEIEDDNDR